MTSEHIFYVIHRAGRWQVYDGDQTQPIAVQDSVAAASHWCRTRVAANEQAVIYSGTWHPRRSA